MALVRSPFILLCPPPIPGCIRRSPAAVVCNAQVAADVVTTAAAAADDGGSVVLAAIGGGAVAALAAALAAADPEKRRRLQLSSSGAAGDEKAAVRHYFDTAGFERWRRIYSDSGDVNRVQLDIRLGHAQTVAKALHWLGPQVAGDTVLDAGCGTGSLAIPLAARGADVTASDISAAMVAEARRRAEAEFGAEFGAESEAVGGAAAAKPPRFVVADLECLSGRYDTVACLDVLIHYPQEQAGSMIRHLASLADKRLLISFAPKTWYYLLLKRVGELFPGPSKATRAYLHAEQDVEAALNSAGWVVTRREMTATSFYFSRLLEAVPAAAAAAASDPSSS